MLSRGKKNSFFGALAGGMLSMFGRTPDRAQLDDLKRADFPASTQRLGIRFSERIRDVFRFRWIKVSRRTASGAPGPSEQSEQSRRSQ